MGTRDEWTKICSPICPLADLCREPRHGLTQIYGRSGFALCHHLCERFGDHFSPHGRLAISGLNCDHQGSAHHAGCRYLDQDVAGTVIGPDVVDFGPDKAAPLLKFLQDLIFVVRTLLRRLFQRFLSRFPSPHFLC